MSSIFKPLNADFVFFSKISILPAPLPWPVMAPMVYQKGNRWLHINNKIHDQYNKTNHYITNSCLYLQVKLQSYTT